MACFWSNANMINSASADFFGYAIFSQKSNAYISQRLSSLLIGAESRRFVTTARQFAAGDKWATYTPRPAKAESPLGFQKSIQGARGPTLLGLKSRPASPGITSVNRATTLSAHIDNAIYASSEIPAQDACRSRHCRHGRGARRRWRDSHFSL